MSECEEDYLDTLKNAVARFYKNDYESLKAQTYELTIAFKIAHYLSMSLIDCEYQIDFEYARMIIDGVYTHKRIHIGERHTENIRPDIIFHKRTLLADNEAIEHNRFAVELKIKDQAGDLQKMRLIVNDLHYKVGYCISNLQPHSFWIYEVRPYDDKYQLHKFAWDGIDDLSEKCSIRRFRRV